MLYHKVGYISHGNNTPEQNFRICSAVGETKNYGMLLKCPNHTQTIATVCKNKKEIKMYS